ncbi:hypothetical protein [Pontiella sulfatireligans]|uniref:Uncharacterized protein n=1 Tax=Pontiella sulfatireligans TaxID=2750658 RepID=A0A6C2UJH3_9BACT|nr:hypothetical protein [Pontiella sulfatireligans]VGO20370.1 hypothetical protein SCARR_02433 [Pontiella sulfatireligans]
MKDILKKLREKAWMEGDPAKDHTVGLAVFGTTEILMGILCFSLAMLLLVVVSASGLRGMKPSHCAMAMGLLFFLTGWFIVMGMGSLKARRWARALLVVGAWVSVFLGTLSLSLVLYILPEVFGSLTDSARIPPTVALGVLYFAVLVLVLLLVVFPLAVIVFNSLKGVQNTCERLNPNPSWTDRTPLPLLTMSFISVLGSLTILAGATTNYTVFIYGHIVSGLPGMAVMALISVAFGYVGRGAYSRKMHAWWGAYALVLVTSSSMMLTFSEIEMPLLYTHMGYSAEQAGSEVFHFITPAMLTLLSCIWGVMACIYLVWVRDCFLPEKDEIVVKSYQQLKAEKEASQPQESTRPRMRMD